MSWLGHLLDVLSADRSIRCSSEKESRARSGIFKRFKPAKSILFLEQEGTGLAEIEKSFKPHPNMAKLFNYYLLMAMLPVIAVALVATSLVYIFEPQYVYVPVMALFIPIAVITSFVFYWIPEYFQSINYHLTRDEVVVEHGVWWKMKHTVPYARVMSVDIIQGPLSRRLGIATVDIYTAGYTGVAGGTGGPGSRRAEASIMHVSSFTETRENILRIVRGRPLFATTASDTSTEMLSELRKMRELLEKSIKK
jgi:hypothetical protein